MSIIFTDENHTCQFDFTKAIWATDQLNTIYHEAGTFLSDVDFIVETRGQLLFIEYKNARHPSVKHPERFHPNEDKLINKLARKYYDSQYYCMGTKLGCSKENIYIVILEYRNADKVTNKEIRNRLSNKLPFTLQARKEVRQQLISKIEVLSIDEWNKKYKEFPLTVLP